MKPFRPHGRRTRPTDKDLVLHTVLAIPLPVFLLIVLLFHAGQLRRIDQQHTSPSQMVRGINLPYLLSSLGIAGLLCLGAACASYHYCRDGIKQPIHRQKLARMILENKWYEVEQVQTGGFSKDLPSSHSKEKITCFPKVYYQLKNGLTHIRTEITLGKYQEQLLNLEKKLENGLYCELTGKELKDSYMEYILLYDTIAGHISVKDVRAKDGKLRLMKNVW